MWWNDLKYYCVSRIAVVIGDYCVIMWEREPFNTKWTWFEKLGKLDIWLMIVPVFFISVSIDLFLTLTLKLRWRDIAMNTTGPIVFVRCYGERSHKWMAAAYLCLCTCWLTQSFIYMYMRTDNPQRVYARDVEIPTGFAGQMTHMRALTHNSHTFTHTAAAGSPCNWYGIKAL